MDNVSSPHSSRSRLTKQKGDEFVQKPGKPRLKLLKLGVRSKTVFFQKVKLLKQLLRLKTGRKMRL